MTKTIDDLIEELDYASQRIAAQIENGSFNFGDKQVALNVAKDNLRARFDVAQIEFESIRRNETRLAKEVDALRARVAELETIRDQLSQALFVRNQQYTELEAAATFKVETAPPSVPVGHPEAPGSTTTALEGKDTTITNVIQPEPPQVGGDIEQAALELGGKVIPGEYEGAWAKIGKNRYPAAWAKMLAGYPNQFEIDGILQKKQLPMTSTADQAKLAVEAYLAEKAAAG